MKFSKNSKKLMLFFKNNNHINHINQTNKTSNRRLEFAFQFDAFMENDFDAAFGDCYSFKKSVDGGGKIYRADQIDDNLWTDYVGG